MIVAGMEIRSVNCQSKQYRMQRGEKKQTLSFSRSLERKCGKIFVELESLAGKLSKSPNQCL